MSDEERMRLSASRPASSKEQEDAQGPDVTAQLVYEAKNDEAAFEQLCHQYHRFIMTCAYQVVRRFVTEHDDEWSTALIAFHEAVEAYDVSKGSFPSFAALVIKRRIADEARREGRHDQELLMKPETMAGSVGDDSDEEPPSAVELEVQAKEREISEEKTEIPGVNPMKDEIDAVSDIFKEYGFTFFDLVDCSPKAGKTRESCAKAVAILLRDGAIFNQMRKTHMLPIAEILRISKLPRKLLERHRKYIIAAAEILHGEYPLLAEYMSSIRKEMKN
ncbi:MAG: sigma factor [Lachnospiraceae bacterium]|nr:sigma factor [Lachnospiraceae bacterium]